MNWEFDDLLDRFYSLMAFFGKRRRAVSIIHEIIRGFLEGKAVRYQERNGVTADIFPLEECGIVQGVIYKMSCCHMNRHHHT